MISIVVPCYNCEKTFTRCIESIQSQTYKEFEIVLVDDGSKDNTYKLCEAVAKEDPRIHVIHQENKGLMNAWKRGVAEATGEYIVFCDSDDYIDSNLIETLEGELKKHQADIILYGMKVEYEDNSVVYKDNMLSEGYYTAEDIKEKILPEYFSNGSMQSGIMIVSRDTKLFHRQILIKNFEFLNDYISVGEDDLVSFAAILSADSIYCIKEYYPYHYIRNNESMIGKYDNTMFEKFVNLKKELDKVAKVYDYPYPDQIEDAFLSYIFLCMKKEICRNRNVGYRDIRDMLEEMRNHTSVRYAIECCSIKKYELKSKVFAYLVIWKWYLGLYVLTRMMDRLGYGKD